MDKAFRYFFACLLMVALWGTSSAQIYQRVVSLAPSLTKNIYFMGAGSQLVGCTSFCQEALDDNKEVVASAIKVNLEKLVLQKPDLVVATGLTDPETIASVKKFGIRIEVFHFGRRF
jgi:ABC-type hemin transport system substrate-binding protein